MRSKMAIVAVVAIMFGCATGVVVSQLAVPEVRAGTNPTRWEYVCGGGYEPKALQEWANKLGREGWELGAAAGGMMGASAPTSYDEKAHFVWCFKRPISTAAPGTHPAR